MTSEPRRRETPPDRKYPRSRAPHRELWAAIESALTTRPDGMTGAELGAVLRGRAKTASRNPEQVIRVAAINMHNTGRLIVVGMKGRARLFALPNGGRR